MRKILALICLLLISITCAGGESPANSVVIVSSEQLTRAYVVFFGENGERQDARAAEFQHRGGDRWEIDVPVTDEDVKDSVTYTAFAETLSGKIIPSAVQSTRKSVVSFSPLSCMKDATVFDDITIERFTSEERKVFRRVKQDRIQKLEERYHQMLTAENLKKINASEQALGIAPPKPLKAETPLEELVRRLVRIQALERP